MYDALQATEERAVKSRDLFADIIADPPASKGAKRGGGAGGEDKRGAGKGRRKAEEEEEEEEEETEEERREKKKRKERKQVKAAESEAKRICGASLDGTVSALTGNVIPPPPPSPSSVSASLPPCYASFLPSFLSCFLPSSLVCVHVWWVCVRTVHGGVFLVFFVPPLWHCWHSHTCALPFYHLLRSPFLSPPALSLLITSYPLPDFFRRQGKGGEEATEGGF